MSCPDGWEAPSAIQDAGDPGAISSEQIDEMLRHADECPECSAPLRDLAARAILAQSPLVRLEPARAARLRARVLAQATGDRGLPAARPVRKRPRVHTGAGGWLAAAALVVALLTHHGFHEPLSSGWLVAAGFAAVALGLGIYALSQKRHVAQLEQQMSSREPALQHDQRKGGG
jgi:hypothetical protein